ncbi:sodium:solute symporter family protein [Polymorphum gilvum]|uniref:SSS sodium solute transporter superfamily n=1 Tax=Polymorphum gilvum (strain LMG 25793 / CGMCC 1.9160 / SL003B-26A1) TaxID=991905 RepID=F2J2L7_POLGS|nr:sodium:solute symporter family protein [Polymorphum gilvum]ADZ70931.1 SSS sodium solute transporter superfamily [Polymorphum gilvum SL003B-26A1]
MALSMKGDFTDNLGKIYGIYVGGFAGFVVLMAILSMLGIPDRFILWAYMAATIGIYAFIGIMSRTAQVSEYYVAGRSVPAVYNGMATGADWMSGASFVGMAGTLFVLGYDGLAFVLGWTGGYVLVAVLLAPYLRKFGAYTVPDFLGTRYSGNAARLVGIVVLFCCSFTYITAQVYASGIIASQFLGIAFEWAVFAGLAGILVCSMLGGMKAVTWTQVAQYIVLIVAYLLPAIWMSTVQFGIPIPQLTYGGALSQIAEYERLLNVAKSHVQPFTTYSPRDYFFLIFCLMVGTASLPHILMRFFTTPTVREARKSVGWSLFFIFLLYFTAPAYAAFSKFNLMGLFVASGADTSYQLAFSAIPQWMLDWGSIAGHQLVTICGVKAETLAAIQAACEAKGLTGGFPYNELRLNNDMIVLSTPSIAGMPIWVVGLVGAGGFAAALSTADGLLLAIANALSHDVYYKMIDPKADAKRRLMVAKILLVVVALAAAFLARTKPSDILSMVAWAFSIAAAGLFAPLVMGVWWKRTTTLGGILGMAAGFATTMYYLIGNVYGFDFVKGTGDEISWFGVASISAGVFGVPVAFVVTYVVSLVTPAPSQEMQDFVDRLRLPKGGTMMVAGH